MSSLKLSPKRITFFIPALILILVFVVYPIIATILLSFNINPIFGVNIVERPPGLENYVKIVFDKKFINPEGIKTLSFPMGAIVHNIIWIAIHLPLTLIVGILFAVFLQYVKGGSIIRSVSYTHLTLPTKA